MTKKLDKKSGMSIIINISTIALIVNKKGQNEAIFKS